MKAICKTNAEAGLTQIRAEVPVPSTNEVLLKSLKQQFAEPTFTFINGMSGQKIQ